MENISLQLPQKIKAALDGNTKTASKLENSKTITILDGENSGASTNFDGSENIFVGTTGILPVANGGTGIISVDVLQNTVISSGEVILQAVMMLTVSK